jgi:hypothetical protein
MNNASLAGSVSKIKAEAVLKEEKGTKFLLMSDEILKLIISSGTRSKYCSRYF